MTAASAAASSSKQEPTLTLYGYFRSSAAARVRTALALKGIPYTAKPVHLLRGEQRDPFFVETLNPSQAVPVLLVDEPGGGSGGGDKQQSKLTQSAAILEFIDERFSHRAPALMPPLDDLQRRATVRAIINIVVCDMQPICNSKVLTKLDTLGINRNEWAQTFMATPLAALERSVASNSTAKRFCVGDQVTLADVALAPQMYTIQRFGITLDAYPTLASIFAHISALPEFVQADWRHQDDTPDEFRLKDGREGAHISKT